MVEKVETIDLSSSTEGLFLQSEPTIAGYDKCWDYNCQGGGNGNPAPAYVGGGWICQRSACGHGFGEHESV